MHATITYRLSSAGQKASILSGGNGQERQTLTVPQDAPEFAAVLQAGTVSTSGQVQLDLTHWSQTLWDHVPTAAEILADLQRRREEAAAEAATEAAKITEDTRTVLRERTVRSTHREETATDGTITARVSYRTSVADWPYSSDQAVRQSPEAVAWEAELASQNEAAKAAAQAQAQLDLATKVQAAEEARQVEAERRAALGLRPGDLDLSIEQGALTEVPTGCWESHSRGKNWLATIQADPASPGGLARQFAEKARGDSYYLLPDLQVGQAIEFGADYYSGRGRRSPTRWYGYVVRVAEARIVVHEEKTGKSAIKAGREYAAVEAAIARVNSEGAIVPSQN
jgi:hypothetical protein